MSVVSSKVEICNLALSLINAGTVADITTNPQTPEELECQRWYDTVRRSILRKYVWNFAKKRTTISRTGTPSFDFADKYTLPIDYIRLLNFGNSDDVNTYYTYQRSSYLYDIVGRDILLNNSGVTSLNIVYIYDNINVNEYDALFIDVLALKLAYKMAYRFTVKKNLVEGVKAALQDAEGEAASIDGQEHPPVRVERSRFNSARKRFGISLVASPYTIFER
jgi:hypothetical protein